MALPTFSFSTTAEEVVTALADQITGKNVLVTGTTIGGLGCETARAMAKHANLVIITGYSAERLKLSEEAIKKQIPSANIRRLELDLSSMAQFVPQRPRHSSLTPSQVLINNAAAAIGHFKLTVDGLESQMAINHVGHFLFTALLAPKLLATRTTSFTPRVVFVSSDAHAYCDGVDLSDAIVRPNAETYDSGQAYYRSKAANILTVSELVKRARGVLQAYSVHPGSIYTNITTKEESREYMQSMGALDADGKPLDNPNLQFKTKTISQGAATTLVAAFDPRIADKPGAYLVDCVVDNAAVAPHASDPVMAEKLWTLTENLIGQPFAFS
ncbi:hypothetical protein C8R45DRAFT_1134913 [Mycena sanguinolenta]|nr:hypothetical protein C8R45DRAFT_1134913 [Mycena sanguinolenta]